MRFSLHSAAMAAAIVGLAGTSAWAESAAVVSGGATGGNGSSSVAIASAPVGSTIVVNGKPCRVVAADNSKHAEGLSGSATASAGGSSVSIGTGSGNSSVVVGSSSNSDGSGSSTCVIVKPQSSAEDQGNR